MSDDKNPSPCPQWPSEWPDWGNAVERRIAALETQPSPLDAAKAYTDERVARVRLKADALCDTLYDVGGVLGRLAALEALTARVEELEKKMVRLSARLDYLQRRIGDLEEDRGLASVQAGHEEPRLGSEEPEGGVVSPKEPAQPIAGTNSEPSRKASLTPGASAGTAKTEAPIAIEVGQVWQWRAPVRHLKVLQVDPGQSFLAGIGWILNETIHANATLVEPAPKTEEPPVLRFDPGLPDLPENPKHWAANVPEPPPVEALLEAARHLESLRPVVYTSQRVGDFRAVASWLRAVAAAMGAEEGRGDG